jgi:hypothetical protein
MRTLLHFCLILLSVTLFQCTEDDFFDKVKKSKGSVIGTVNGQLYSDLKPKSIYSTEVVVKKDNTTCQEEFPFIEINSWYDKKWFSQHLYIGLKSLNSKSVYNLKKSKENCEDYIPISIMSIWDLDNPITFYYLDTTYNNVFIIDTVTRKIVEGSFDFKFISRYINTGVKNPHSDVPDYIHFVCSKFVAIR